MSVDDQTVAGSVADAVVNKVWLNRVKNSAGVCAKLMRTERFPNLASWQYY